MFDNQFIQEFQENASPTLSSPSMEMAIESIKAHQKNKNRTFNCFVCDENSNKKEWVQFLKAIQTNKAGKEGRCQVLYKRESHWSVMDLQIKNGQIDIFLVDSANSLPHVLNTIKKIARHCPKARIKYLGPSIQHDNASCGYFALDQALALSKIDDLHQILPSYVYYGSVGSYGSYLDYIKKMIQTPFLERYNTSRLINAIEKVGYISSNRLPEQFGGLLKNIQSLSDQRFSKKDYFTNNHTLLDDYIAKHTGYSHDQSADEEPKKQNLALEYKKRKIRKRALSHIEHHQGENTCANFEFLLKYFGVTLIVPSHLERSQKTPGLFNTTQSNPPIVVSMDEQFKPLERKTLETFKNNPTIDTIHQIKNDIEKKWNELSVSKMSDKTQENYQKMTQRIVITMLLHLCDQYENHLIESLSKTSQQFLNDGRSIDTVPVHFFNQYMTKDSATLKKLRVLSELKTLLSDNNSTALQDFQTRLETHRETLEARRVNVLLAICTLGLSVLLPMMFQTVDGNHLAKVIDCGLKISALP